MLEKLNFLIGNLLLSKYKIRITCNELRKKLLPVAKEHQINHQQIHDNI